MRLWPRSLLGQTLLAVALALLAAQLISSLLLVRAAENRREAIAVNSSAMLLAYEAPRLSASRRNATERGSGQHSEQRGRQRVRLPVIMRDNPPPFIERGEFDAARTAAIAQVLAENDIRPVALHATVREAGTDPYVSEVASRSSHWRDPEWRERRLLVTAMQLRKDGPWFVSRVPIANPERFVLGGILLQTGVLFLVLLGVLFLLLRRITRPLARLSDRVEQFTRTQTASQPLAPSGPEDVARLITAHNAMEARIAAMLDEKDVMLGAIGHDLKTPLAALRVRIESIVDAAARAKMAATIEEITVTLDDILTLARIGRAGEELERTNLGALAASVVEEFEDMGEPVELGEIPRLVVSIRPTWLKRAIRNLVSNAVRYGGKAEVSLISENGNAVLRVSDNGPGIPADKIADMLEPFRRGETSRNRATGGSGLGLTLARAIAEQHGGRLVLENRAEGGLKAEIRLPL